MAGESTSSLGNMVLRGLQLIFAVVVIAMSGRGIHLFQSYDVIGHTPLGDFTSTHGVPDSWGFLIFCSLWTILAVILSLTGGNSKTTGRTFMDFLRLGVEIVAALSWFAGFIAVAVNIGGEVCRAGDRNHDTCRWLVVATVFAAAEWVLFVITAIQTRTLLSSNMR